MTTKVKTETLKVRTIVGDDFGVRFVPSGHGGMFVEIYEDPFDMSAKLVSEREVEAKLAKARKIELAESPPSATPKRPEGVPEGHDWWYENGVKHAPKVAPLSHGSHHYPGDDGTSDCSHGCGCWMGPYRSGGPVNPGGRCPENPILKEPNEEKSS